MKVYELYNWCRCGVCAWLGAEWVRGLGLGFTNPVGTGELWDVCLFFRCVRGNWCVVCSRVWESSVMSVADIANPDLRAYGHQT